MLLTITNRAAPATDLGYLLHKNPANLHTAQLGFGQAHVFYSAAVPDECTAHLALDIDPVGLVRGARQLEDYVNDRPYVSSSYLTVALNRLFGTALAGNCAQRPDLVHTKLPLTLQVECIRVRGGIDVLQRLFQPLGYQLQTSTLPLDPQFPAWGESHYVTLTLTAEVTVHDALSHLFVLLPVLDDYKHYYLGQAEVDKLLRHGEGWLPAHPERDLIVQRYLRRRGELTSEAFQRLQAAEESIAQPEDEPVRQTEAELERPLTLHSQRLNLVAARLKDLGARSVVDLGCGEGKLLRRLLADRFFEKLAGMDVSHRSLQTAAQRLRLDSMPERQRQRLQLFQGSLLYRDQRLAGFDAATLVEVIEHLDRPRLTALERVLFEFARPHHILITTPNREYNVLFPTLPAGKFRHNDHRFEWTRAEFASWAEATAGRFGYEVKLEPAGPVDESRGAPSQMAVFSLPTGAAQ